MSSRARSLTRAAAAVLLGAACLVPAVAHAAEATRAQSDPAHFNTVQRILPGGEDAYSGSAVAIDGDVALVAAQPIFQRWMSGTVTVWEYSTGAWRETASLPSSETDDAFGGAIAVSGDTAVIGAWEDSATGARSGAAYVYTREGGTWSRTAKLTATEATAEARFGYAVAVSGDTIAIGAPADQTTVGAVHVFTRSGDSWEATAVLRAAESTEGDRFAESVAVSGSTVLVGALATGEAATGAGYVFAESGGSWTQQASLISTRSTLGDLMGTDVALDGDTAVLGAPGDDAFGSESGSLHVFARADGAWTETAELLAPDGAPGDWLGNSVSVSGDTIIAGAHGDNDKGGDAGSAYVFRLGPDGWTLRTKFTPAEGYSFYGYDVAVSDGTSIVGAPLDGDRASLGGSVWFGRARYRINLLDSFSVHLIELHAPGVLANDTPASGTEATLVAGPAHGTVSLETSGGWLYTADQGFMGRDSFSYVASGPAGASVPASVNVDVKRLTTLTLTTTSKTLASYGQGFSVRGKLMGAGGPLAGKRVTLQSSANNHIFRNRGRATTTAADGTFSFHLVPRNKTYFRVRYFEDEENFSALSAKVWANPRAAVGRPHLPSSVTHGKSYRVWGTFKPAHTLGKRVVRVYRYRLVHGRWRSYGYVYANQVPVEGSSYFAEYAGSIRLPYRGRWRVRALHSDSTHAKSWSPYEYVYAR